MVYPIYANPRACSCACTGDACAFMHTHSHAGDLCMHKLGKSNQDTVVGETEREGDKERDRERKKKSADRHQLENTKLNRNVGKVNKQTK